MFPSSHSRDKERESPEGETRVERGGQLTVRDEWGRSL